jgi:2,3-dihydro-2,3-dihydroxybenzoate dehydrogenase
LLLVGRDEKKICRVSDSLGAEIDVMVLSGDVGDSDFCRRVIEETQSRFGRLDVLVNNAGVMHRGPAEQTSDEDWARVMRVNVDGVFYLSRNAVGIMRQQQGGAIVNVGSTLSLVGASGLAAYCTSKGAVAQLTRAMALECAIDDITVNAVCPGAIDSPMLYSEYPTGTDVDAVCARNAALIPKGVVATADEVARAIVFLASEPHITGALLSVDGGYVAQ